MDLNLPTLPFPPDMLLAIAAGHDTDFNIAAAYGIPASEFSVIRETASFKAALAKAQEVVDANGEDAEVVEHALLQTMAGEITKSLYEVYHQGVTPTDMKIRIASVLYNREDQMRNRLRPKAQGPAHAAGEGFKIIINIPSALPAPQPTTIDVTPE